jgi:hypothetical protein
MEFTRILKLRQPSLQGTGSYVAASLPPHHTTTILNRHICWLNSAPLQIYHPLFPFQLASISIRSATVGGTQQLRSCDSISKMVAFEPFWHESFDEVERSHIWLVAHDTSVALSKRKRDYQAVLNRSRTVSDPDTRKRHISANINRVARLDDVDKWPAMKVLEDIHRARQYPPGDPRFLPAMLTRFNYNLAEVSDRKDVA